MENLEKFMRESVKSGKAQILTVSLAESLKGKRIRTVYFGYHGQNGVDDFVVGNVVSEYEYYRNLKEDCFNDHPKGFKNRAEYWESYMSPDRIGETKNTLVLLSADGKNTRIFASKENNGAFTCSDSDRFVYFVEHEN
jgi:hypothetical protein